MTATENGRMTMREIGKPEYGVTPCEYTYQRVKITATYEKVIEVDVDEDFDKAIETAFDGITLEDLDYDYEELGEDTDIVYVYR